MTDLVERLRSPILYPNITDEAATEIERLRRYLDAWNIIDALRSEEGDSVTIFADDPDLGGGSAIECNGSWTEWFDERFTGSTIWDALKVAAKAKRLAAC